MRQFKILKDFPGSPDGGRVIEFTAGQFVDEGSDFPQSLIDVALREKWAVEVKGREVANPKGPENEQVNKAGKPRKKDAASK